MFSAKEVKKHLDAAQSKKRKASDQFKKSRSLEAEANKIREEIKNGNMSERKISSLKEKEERLRKEATRAETMAQNLEIDGAEMEKKWEEYSKDCRP